MLKHLFRRYNCATRGKHSTVGISKRYEDFVASYLRLNAYFTITNFVVHAGDDLSRISNGMIGNYTETDILGVRMPYSEEKVGHLQIANHEALVAGSHGKTDIVIVEVKSGGGNTPNRAWKSGELNAPIRYIARFLGIGDAQEKIDGAANALATTFRFEDESIRIRFMVVAPAVNKEYARRGVTYITFRQIIEFIVDVRGQCWIEANMGVASSHLPWDKMLTKIFTIANDFTLERAVRIERIESYLDSSEE